MLCTAPRHNHAFVAACKAGQLPVTHELLALTGDRAMDVHVWGNKAFYAACCNRFDEVMGELIVYIPDSVNLDAALKGEPNSYRKQQANFWLDDALLACKEHSAHT